MPLFTLAEIMVLTTCKDLFDAIKLVNDKICQCDFILDSDNIIVKKESRDLNKMIFFRCYLLIMPFPILQRRTAKIISELMRKIIKPAEKAIRCTVSLRFSSNCFAAFFNLRSMMYRMGEHPVVSAKTRRKLLGDIWSDLASDSNDISC